MSPLTYLDPSTLDEVFFCQAVTPNSSIKWGSQVLEIKSSYRWLTSHFEADQWMIYFKPCYIHNKYTSHVRCFCVSPNPPFPWFCWTVLTHSFSQQTCVSRCRALSLEATLRRRPTSQSRSLVERRLWCGHVCERRCGLTFFAAPSTERWSPSPSTLDLDSKLLFLRFKPLTLWLTGVSVGLGLGLIEMRYTLCVGVLDQVRKSFEASAYVSLNSCSQTPFLDSRYMGEEIPTMEQGWLWVLQSKPGLSF